MNAAPEGTHDLSRLRVALIGYGEVGHILGGALRAHGLASLSTFDRLFDVPARRDEMRQRARDDGVLPAETAAAAVADADLVICAVTADQTSVAARSVTAGLRAGAFYVDVNSASPQTKCDCAALIDAAGGRYV